MHRLQGRGDGGRKISPHRRRDRRCDAYAQDQRPREGDAQRRRYRRGRRPKGRERRRERRRVPDGRRVDRDLPRGNALVLTLLPQHGHGLAPPVSLLRLGDNFHMLPQLGQRRGRGGVRARHVQRLRHGDQPHEGPPKEADEEARRDCEALTRDARRRDTVDPARDRRGDGHGIFREGHGFVRVRRRGNHNSVDDRDDAFGPLRRRRRWCCVLVVVRVAQALPRGEDLGRRWPAPAIVVVAALLDSVVIFVVVIEAHALAAAAQVVGHLLLCGGSLRGSPPLEISPAGARSWYPEQGHSSTYNRMWLGGLALPGKQPGLKIVHL
mmetsp:Transcript_21513/g.60682  ORF Transcript_21513/g.60682 Transcript_21513/m.60682 type:complete len:324 (+) Transcript_21513:441-1412(+)